ncbi:MAG: YebC/PmpR family DNA-binding transcriptional regulator [Bacteroidetes bacterium]|jgi:YebC/PmpR family DNA-binding regulatory protein|nr:YebC/PmpR family DNA-binding transcriptional regulator [Bacteroidota bacterium]MBT3747959.1 YebC/PmpR family DNA-binding transcriptional regulator [Bacteroidota bacterium]MBT4401235.1 YebC/PmpR family DNA-binding transcriptional regulator [Bacteroidota bacterium]MBT4409197.1 YebC/PmpR family DNA-binding transcriptional regulator [Bacteroidota bacterium]MBT7091894.1 YebC/PmpR family DNA-binding transcriptional regulator [Bacteroidota bacterium]
MSGHSKWSTIKRKKGAADAKRSKMFSKVVKEIMIAAREGGPDPDMNPKLRMAISNAKGVNMPKDNVQRAINKGSSDEGKLDELTFEGHGPGGVAIFVDCLTDNHLRTVGSVRSIFNKRGGNLGTNGSLSFLFDRKGVFEVAKGELDPDEFELEIIDAGVEEMEVEEDHFLITCALEDFGNVQKKLEEMNLEPEKAELQRIPTTTKEVELSTARSVMAMIDFFEDDDDVQAVYHNMELTDEIAEALSE